MKLPIGIEDFAMLRQNNYYFVDKSLFIKDLLDRSPKVLVMTRPPRFGKSLLLSMLKYFFSSEYGKGNRHLFDGLAIEQAGSPYMDEQGEKPVVMISLKECRGTTWAQMLENLKSKMAALYQQYMFLMENNAISDVERQYFTAICNKESNTTGLESSLQQLLQFVQQHYHKPVVLLIDDYDMVIQQAWENDFYTEACTFMGNFLGSALKTNPALDFALLAGVLGIPDNNFFLGLNNVVPSSVVNESYPTTMGFTRDEVTKLASTLGQKQRLPEIAQWYGGYHYAGMEIYNPWSVISYFANHCHLQCYWDISLNQTMLKQLIPKASHGQHNRLLQLHDGQNITAIIDEGTFYEDIGENADTLYTLLLIEGYLTAESIQWGPAGQECTLAIPNKEVHILWQKIFRHLS